MRELEFSIMVHEPGEEKKLEPLLQAFEKQTNIRVHLRGITWNDGWKEVLNFGITHKGPDVSEVGTTWIGSLAAMQALRPFTSTEVAYMGGADSFFRGNWQSGFLPMDPRPWAIPWLGDEIVVYYWKDALAKTGITDRQAAFSDHPSFVDTLERLRAAGYHFPLALSTMDAHRVLHEACSWIWSAGGSLLSPDGKRVTFGDPEAINGLRSYFSLGKYVPLRETSREPSHILFEQQKTAVVLAGPWQGIIGCRQNAWGNNLGIANLLTTAYVGGSSLVIWKNSPCAQESLELIRFIAQQPSSIPGSPHSIMLPVRKDSFSIPSVSEDIFERTCLRALESGNTFPTSKQWGSIERRLNQELANIWADRLDRPDENLDECIHRHIDPLVQRMNNSLME